MGWTTAEVKKASVFELSAAMAGWAKQYDDPTKMSEADKDEVWAWLQSKDDYPLTHPNRKKRKGNGAAKVETTYREAL